MAFAVCLAAVLTVAAGCTSTGGEAVATSCTDANVPLITDANVPLIQAASYDQSCTVDSDCVAIGEGNACYPCIAACKNAAINAGAKAQYLSDVSKRSAGDHAGDSCGCPASYPTCCRGGSCHADSQCVPVPVPTCELGATCSDTQVCMGGIVGCTSNCQCLGGTWQAPCPQDLPQTGGACTGAGAQCGYVTSTNACGAASCSCQGGTWSCGPTCALLPTDAGADAGGD